MCQPPTQKIKSNIMYTNMIIIVGLGNPGEQFEKTRHNVGFMVVDFFAKKNNFPDFELEKKYDALTSKKGKVLLAKPQTFMNKSGLAVKQIQHLTPKTQNLIVIHDDIDLPLGKIKIVKNRGSAGHKGVESIIRAVGNKNLARIRVGTAPLKGKAKSPESFVIKNFTEEDQKIITKTIKKIADALDVYIAEGLEKAMNEYN